jgi:hypothetical protein
MFFRALIALIEIAARANIIATRANLR